MSHSMPARRAAPRRSAAGRILAIASAVAALWPGSAHASLFHGETLDKIAGVLAWIVLIIVPIVAVVVFWLVHILPEKIAEKKHHPQTQAIQTLCLLSLVFGGILWPLAWLWAYTKPVLYKAAYGKDKVVHGQEEKEPETSAGEPPPNEVDRLRSRVAELEARLASEPATRRV